MHIMEFSVNIAEKKLYFEVKWKKKKKDEIEHLKELAELFKDVVKK